MNTKLDQKDQKAGAEMEKDQKAGAEVKKDQKAGAEMKKFITPVSGEAWVFVEADCPIVEAAETLLSKLKEQKFITEVKKVVTPTQGEVWVFVREDRPTIEAGSQPMGPVMRKMDEVDITASTVKNVAQLIGVGVDIHEHGVKKVLSEIGTSTRPVDKDREKLYESAEAIRRKTFKMEEKMLEEFAEVKGKLNEIAASQKRGGSFGPKTGKKGKGDDGGENGDDENNNGSGGDTGGNGGDGGWGLAGVIKSLRDIISGNGS